jgi:hypothetical protein
MSARTGCRIIFTLAGVLALTSPGYGEPALPVVNATDQSMKLDIKDPKGNNITIDLNKKETKFLDLIAGVYEVRVRDGKGNSSPLGGHTRWNLQQELAKDPKARIHITERYSYPDVPGGVPRYEGPDADLHPIELPSVDGPDLGGKKRSE